ncbi:MAG: hypothetical protein Q7S98_04165, partial [Deltaproteobacteria bacterium]|nr:hypothetical protein [Deltaproteobacteria bacterium]
MTIKRLIENYDLRERVRGNFLPPEDPRLQGLVDELASLTSGNGTEQVVYRESDSFEIRTGEEREAVTREELYVGLIERYFGSSVGIDQKITLVQALLHEMPSEHPEFLPVKNLFDGGRELFFSFPTLLFFVSSSEAAALAVVPEVSPKLSFSWGDYPDEADLVGTVLTEVTRHPDSDQFILTFTTRELEQNADEGPTIAQGSFQITLDADTVEVVDEGGRQTLWGLTLDERDTIEIDLSSPFPGNNLLARNGGRIPPASEELLTVIEIAALMNQTFLRQVREVSKGDLLDLNGSSFFMRTPLLDKPVSLFTLLETGESPLLGMIALDPGGTHFFTVIFPKTLRLIPGRNGWEIIYETLSPVGESLINSLELNPTDPAVQHWIKTVTGGEGPDSYRVTERQFRDLMAQQELSLYEKGLVARVREMANADILKGLLKEGASLRQVLIAMMYGGEGAEIKDPEEGGGGPPSDDSTPASGGGWGRGGPFGGLPPGSGPLMSLPQEARRISYRSSAETVRPDDGSELLSTYSGEVILFGPAEIFPTTPATSRRQTVHGLRS